MALNRKEFTDKEKAAIYARDRATCCFSGANLWLLDAPLRYGWESDWVDHVHPASRGGAADVENNGVCASATYNMKKRANSADKTYLFNGGIPTALYFEMFGSPPVGVADRLKRLEHLMACDWYFNRTLTWILQAFHYKIWSDTWETLPSRDDTYWFKAAYKKLNFYQDYVSDILALEERKIIPDKPAENQKVFLSLRTCDSFESMQRTALQLLPNYKINSDIWWNYFHPCDDDRSVGQKKIETKRQKAYEKACKVQNQLTHDTFECIQSDYKIRYGTV